MFLGRLHVLKSSMPSYSALLHFTPLYLVTVVLTDFLLQEKTA